MSEPIQLKIAKSDPQEKVIDLLRDMMARAERGDMLSIVAVTELREHGWGTFVAGVENNGFKVAGMLSYALHDINAAIRNGGMPEDADPLGKGA